MFNFYAQPYDICANGFYFGSIEEYNIYAARNYNKFGDFVEEYEIQLIDAPTSLDCAVINALSPNQCNIERIIDICENWDDDDKVRLLLAEESGYSFNVDTTELCPNDLPEIEIYEEYRFDKLAEQFVDDGIYGEIPENLAHYIDYEAIGRDLQVDYARTNIAGTDYIFRCE